MSNTRACVIAFLALVSAASLATDNDPGRQLFLKEATPSCSICHSLADAGASGAIGPSLDELKPDATRVAKALKTGIGQMPAYPQLTEEQVQAIARYVARASGGAK
ncbi:MAG: SorU family sulfite dehydrogenase c-type cytochrome subunit [Burkholderiaceae bacterium]